MYMQHIFFLNFLKIFDDDVDDDDDGDDDDDSL